MTLTALPLDKVIGTLTQTTTGAGVLLEFGQGGQPAGQAQTYTDATIASLTANQVAGIDPILAANASRRALVINPAADCGLTLSAGGPILWPMFANVPNSFTGAECPSGALYLTAGLTAAQTLPIAVA